MRRLVLNLQIRTVTLNYFGEDDAAIIEGLHSTRTAEDTRTIIRHDSDILSYPRVLFVQQFRPDDRAEAKGTLQEVIKRAQNLRVFKQVNAL